MSRVDIKVTCSMTVTDGGYSNAKLSIERPEGQIELFERLDAFIFSQAVIERQVRSIGESMEPTMRQAFFDVVKINLESARKYVAQGEFLSIKSFD